MTLLEVKGLSVHFPTRNGTVRAVDGVSFALSKGESLGIVGESGSGKTVTALSILQLLDPPGRIVSGEILLDGEDLVRKSERELLQIRGKRIAAIFQEPATSLNPTLTIGNQLREVLAESTYDAWRSGALAGIARSLRDRIAPDRQGEAHLREKAIALLSSIRMPSASDTLRKYPYMMSGGMLQRAMIAMAIAGEPDLLIADEPTTALDVTIQAQILDILRDRISTENLTMLMITHDLGIVADMCDRVAVMYASRLIEQAKTVEIFDSPHHPYTRGLLASMPSIESQSDTLKAIEGVVPDLAELDSNSCYFASRCPLATEVCRTERPPLIEVSSGHEVACHVHSHPSMRSLKPQLENLWPPSSLGAGQEPTRVLIGSTQL